MGVFREKFAAQGNSLGVIRGHPNRINSGVAAMPLHAGNVVGIGIQNLCLIGFKGQLLQRRPLLEPDSTLGEFSLNLSRSFRHQ
jgi:hypothetical protein